MELTSFKPTKILVVGMTDKLIAHKIFEEELTREFSLCDINAAESTIVFNETFTDSKLLIGIDIFNVTKVAS